MRAENGRRCSISASCCRSGRATSSKIYAWKLILAKEGILTWVFESLHIGFAARTASSPSRSSAATRSSVSYIGTFLVFVYVWMPFMILPIQAALERVPVNLIERLRRSRRHAAPDLPPMVIFPLALPGIIAGSIFTFSLTLGDYIIPQIIGSSRLFIGQAVYAQQGTAGNIPLAAAFTVVPIVIMGLYLWMAKRMGPSMRSDRPIGLARPQDRRRCRAALPACADAADLPLCLHHRGEELSVAAAGADARAGSPSPGTGRTSGRR